METEPISTWRWVVLLSCLLFSQPVILKATAHTSRLDVQVDYLMDFAEDQVKERLQLLDQSLLEHRFDKSVRDLIAYHLRYPAQTARNIGRAVAYFPVFESELAAAGLPEALKYLPVIESALRPEALSRVGAQGLWQFMPFTAPEYGLLIDAYVDERLDAYQATRAAIKYLADAYDYLNDWSLAIAAYNAGKGGVRRAMRRNGGKDFWSVRRYLPKETRNYVPAFIAAIYLTEFYAAHGIIPEMPPLDEQLVARVVVYQPLSFYRIAQVTGLSIEVIQRLNPSYRKGYLPGYAKGHNLILPQRVAAALRDYLAIYADSPDEPILPWAPVLLLPAYAPHDDTDYEVFFERVTDVDSLQSIAEKIQIPVSQLAIWNSMSPLDTLVQGQTIKYFQPVALAVLPQRTVNNSTWRAPSLAVSGHLTTTHLHASPLPAILNHQLFLSLTQKEKPSAIVARFPYLEMTHFLSANELANDKALPAGSVVRIPRK